MDQNELKLERALIGRRLRQARLRSNSTIEEAAVANGVQPLAVKRWETGKAMPCLVQFRTLLGLYGTVPCDLLFESNPFRLTRGQAAELLGLSRACSPQLRGWIEFLVSSIGEPTAGRPAGESTAPH